MNAPISIEPIAFPSTQLAEIMMLHREASKTLGFFPKGAFEDHARRRQIFVATTKTGECVGYILYRIARGRATIVHLCVANSARNLGIARNLINRIKSETKDLEGISLYCRRDFAVNKMWSKFGFEAVNKKSGRGKDGAELTFWWFSHGHEDLFSRVWESDPVRQRVVIDANVFYDLHFRDTQESEESKALLADWVQSSIELVITKELQNEIFKAPDPTRRRESLAAATYYNKLPSEDAYFQELCGTIEKCFPKIPATRDHADVRQVAYAVAGKAAFFVTRDEALIQQCEGLYLSHGLTVLHPAELINRLDSIEREAEYRPALIEGSRLKNTLLKTELLEAVIDDFKRPDERVNEFRKRLLTCLSQPKSVDVQVITDESGTNVLLGVMGRETESTMEIPVLRQAKHGMAATMMRNFLRASLTSAADEDRDVVTLTEPRLEATDLDILREFGFIPSGTIWVKFALRALGSLNEIQTLISNIKARVEFEPAWRFVLQQVEAAKQHRDVKAFSAIERQLWPLKVAEPNIPSFIVPIQPRWAQHFFDAELGSQLLFGLREDLHLGVEGVYYKKLRNNNLLAPGRVLWYVSKGDGTGSKSVKACSMLEEVVIGKPKELFRKFQRLGVYEWRDIYAAAASDVSRDIVAFRFRMTERFKCPVEMKFLEALDIRGPFMSPRQVTHSQFSSIYRAGCAFT